MANAPKSFGESPEALIVGLARTGDRDAFSELVRRRQSWIRSLMRRCCGDETLADDLAQQVFLQAWRDIRKVRQPRKFGGWLRRLAINVWRQHVRKHDPLGAADEADDAALVQRETTGVAMDLDRTLPLLPHPQRLCVVLAYQEGLTHAEIATLTDLPLGTVKSHVRRGAERLKELLSAYGPSPEEEYS